MYTMIHISSYQAEHNQVKWDFYKWDHKKSLIVMEYNTERHGRVQ